LHAQFDDPYYEPSDRLLVRYSGRVVAHVHLLRRTMYFQGLKVPICQVNRLATLPEHRSRGYARGLLTAADHQMIEDGALAATVQTSTADVFTSCEYVAGGRCGTSRADARAVLGQLSAGPLSSPLALPPVPLNIRLWRQFELPALQRIYRQNASRLVGPLVRSEAYWRWLISCATFERIYVAIDGPDHLEPEQQGSPIVGYAVVRGQHILELMTTPGHPTAARELLARVCADAIERDCHAVVCHAPGDDSMHGLFARAGGQFHLSEDERNKLLMTRLLRDPVAFATVLCPLLYERARAAPFARPCSLGIDLDGRRLRLKLTRRSARFESGSLGRHYLRLDTPAWTRLVAGHTSAAQLLDEGQAEVSSARAREIVQAVFPSVVFWRPPWDGTTA
jgi:GNAT superfamily N-acetyltransferase